MPMKTRDLITEKLTKAFAPQSLDVVDESHQHAGPCRAPAGRGDPFPGLYRVGGLPRKEPARAPPHGQRGTFRRARRRRPRARDPCRGAGRDRSFVGRANATCSGVQSGDVRAWVCPPWRGNGGHGRRDPQRRCRRRHICRQALPRSRGGLRQMVRAGQRVRLASTCVRFSSAIGDGVSFLASQDPT